jgi:hypothetical protein
VKFVNCVIDDQVYLSEKGAGLISKPVRVTGAPPPTVEKTPVTSPAREGVKRKGERLSVRPGKGKKEITLEAVHPNGHGSLRWCRRLLFLCFWGMKRKFFHRLPFHRTIR